MADPNELRLVLIGKTGCGKSDTGNKILGVKHFKASVGGSSITKQCNYRKGFNVGRDIGIVDTPGLFDTELDNAETQDEIKRCVLLSAPGPHAIIFVTRIGRYTNEERKTIDHFVNNFGEGMYKYMIVLFTGGDDLEEEGKTLDEFVAAAPPELKKVLHFAGNRKVVFNNREKNVDILERQVRNLIQMVDQTVALNGGSCYTNQMYQEAEARLKEKEEEEKRKAEAEKQEQINKIKNECKADMDEQIKKLEAAHEAAMKRIRDEHREAIANMNRGGGGLLGQIGQFLDRVLPISIRF